MQKIKRSLSLMLVLTVLFTTMVVTGSITTEAKVFKKEGEYSTSLCTKKDKNDKYSSYAKKLVFKGKKFTLYGSMHYTKPGDVYSSKIYKPAKRTYIISKKCKFYKKTLKNGKWRVKKLTYKKIKKHVLPLEKGSFSTEQLAWVIKDGKVTELFTYGG